jgi:hypothetical protein
LGLNPKRRFVYRLSAARRAALSFPRGRGEAAETASFFMREFSGKSRIAENPFYFFFCCGNFP